MSEGLREFPLIGKFDVQVYGWLYNAEYRQYRRVQRVYNGVQSTRLVRCRTSAVIPSSRLVMRNVRLYTKSGSIFLIILFSFALISGTANYLAKLKKKMGTLLAAAPCPYPSAFLAQSPHFLFSDLELEALVVDKERESRKQERGLQRVLPLPLGERRTLDVDEACEINVKGTMALLLAQQ